MISENLTKALNNQLTHEFQAAHLYTAMASYFSKSGFHGFANFYLVQYEQTF